jgi:hypothetical protein
MIPPPLRPTQGPLASAWRACPWYRKRLDARPRRWGVSDLISGCSAVHDQRRRVQEVRGMIPPPLGAWTRRCRAPVPTTGFLSRAQALSEGLATTILPSPIEPSLPSDLLRQRGHQEVVG